MKKAAVAAFVLSSCAPAMIQEYRGPRLKGEIERYILLAEYAFETSTGKAVDPPSDLEVKIKFFPERPKCDANPFGSCHGILVKKSDHYVIELKSESCLPNTSLGHELMHYWSIQAYGDADTRHNNPFLFGHDYSAERRVRAAGIFEGMCQ